MHFENIRQIESDFYISGEHVDDATSVLKKLLSYPEDSPDGFMRIAGDQGWDVRRDPESGNLYGIWWSYAHDDMDSNFLEIIAPYVSEGSYIDITEHDGDAFWRLYFDGKTCKAYEGELSFPGCPRS